MVAAVSLAAVGGLLAGCGGSASNASTGGSTGSSGGTSSGSSGGSSSGSTSGSSGGTSTGSSSGSSGGSSSGTSSTGGTSSGAGTSTGGTGSSGSAGGSITLYNGQHQQTTQALVAAFERQTGIHVNERDGDEAGLTQQIEQEGSATRADVIFTENSPALMTLQEKGFLAPAPSTGLTQVPAKYSSPQGDWVGVSARVSVLVYNTSKLKPADLPTSVMDLADPRWKGLLALAPTETDFQPVVTSVAQSRGEQAALTWLKGVKANAASHIEPDNEAVTADVDSGQAAIGLIDHYYWYRFAKGPGAGSVHSAVAYFASADPGYVMDVSGAGILKTSKHQAAAQQFLTFLTSAAGQQVIVDSNSFEYPLRQGATSPPGLRPFAELQPAPISVAELGDGSEALHLIQQVQLV
jgi:iron(III) transport system substrate-binding protein